MPVVLDASALIAFAVPDERSEIVDGVIHSGITGETRLITSEHAKLEVAEALNRGVRRGRLSEDARRQSLDLIGRLPVHYYSLEGTPSDYADLASKEELSAYDAAYVFLAIRCNAILVTTDTRLLAACQRLGVDWRP